MTTAKDVTEHAVAIVCAAFGVSGVVPVALSVLAICGIESFRREDAACRKIIADVAAGLETNGTEPHVLKEALNVLATGNKTIETHPGSFPDPQQKQALNDAYVDFLMRLVPETASFDANSIIRILFQHAVSACRYRPEVHARISQDLLWRVRGDTLEIKQYLIEIHADLTAKNDLLVSELAGFEGELAGVLYAYGHDKPADRNEVLAGVRAAMEALRQAEIRNALPSNVDARMNWVLTEVRQYRRRGRNQDAITLLQRERREAAQRQELAQKERLRLCEETVLQGRVANIPDVTAHALEEAITLEGHQFFEKMLYLCNGWCERGRSLGLTFDLQVSIFLANRCAEQTSDTETHFQALSLKAKALFTLGEFGKISALHEAITANKAALELTICGGSRKKWASTQINLGNALSSLVSRGHSEALDDAIVAYTAALTVSTYEADPMEWAGIQNNLGNLSAAARRSAKNSTLHDPATYYRAALKVRTRENFPNEFAATQNNLGSELIDLYNRGKEISLGNALKAIRSALDILTKEKQPVEWAQAQLTLGNALCLLGRRGERNAFKDSNAAYSAALEVYRSNTLPLKWAHTRQCMSVCLTFQADKFPENAKKHLDDAYCAVGDALMVYTSRDMPFHFEKATALRDRILAAIARL